MDLTLKSGISTYQTFRTISRMENGGLKYPWKGVKCLCNEIFFSGHFFKTKYRCGEYLSRILRTTKQKQTTSDIWLASIFVFVSGGKKICSSSHETGLEFSFMSKSIWYYFYKVVISCERIYLTGESALFFPPGFSRTALSLGFTYPRTSTFHEGSVTGKFSMFFGSTLVQLQLWGRAKLKKERENPLGKKPKKPPKRS